MKRLCEVRCLLKNLDLLLRNLHFLIKNLPFYVKSGDQFDNRWPAESIPVPGDAGLQGRDPLRGIQGRGRVLPLMREVRRTRDLTLMDA